jgi:adenosylhomocysteine nucleosidase
MKTLVTFALDWEFKPWLRLGNFQHVPGNGRTFRAQTAGCDVTVVLTGVGAVNSARTIRGSVEEIPDVCIVSGLAGGLKHQHRPGEILVARAARAESTGTAYQSDEALFTAAVVCGAKPVEQFISTGQVVRTAQEKFRLGTTADAVDMESFAVMKEMRAMGVPSVAIRSLADPAEMDVPCDFDRALDGSGHIRIARVLGQVASDPRKVWRLAQLGVRSTRAASSLARYLEGLTAYLASHKEITDLSVQHISQ